ncbi:MAG: type I-MYXAN CRISPR-associated protein Cas5/Cmx5/DevS [Blastocatellia bacterium]
MGEGVETIWLRIRAPFAAFRLFQAGGYRATYPVIPPSVAYGLVLNFAGLEMRGSLSGLTTGIRDGLPELGIAVGLLRWPRTAKLFQQLHSYPVGGSASRLSARTHGAKYLIAPARRELLVGYDGVVGVRTPDPSLAGRVRKGVEGQLDVERYGLPFLGDNNLTIDEVDLLAEPPPAWWYCEVGADRAGRRGVCRLTVGIDRVDNSRTTAVTMAPTERPFEYPPEAAWVVTPGRM